MTYRLIIRREAETELAEAPGWSEHEPNSSKGRRDRRQQIRLPPSPAPRRHIVEFSTRGIELDINSGDLRGMRVYPDGAARFEIYESELSKEVRRLGIPIPGERRWWIIDAPSSRGMYITYVYEDLLPTAGRLLDLLDEVKATDEERRTVLKTLMASLRTEKPLTAMDRTRTLLVEIRDRYGLESPVRPDYTERLRQLGSGKEY